MSACTTPTDRSFHPGFRMCLRLLAHVRQPGTIVTLLEKCRWLEGRGSKDTSTAPRGGGNTSRLSAEISGHVNNHAYVPLFFYTTS